MNSLICRAALLVCALTLGACAGGEAGGGYAQLLTISTLPTGAECEFTREGEAIGKVSPTPGTLRVTRSSKPISMSCTKDGHDGASEKLVPRSNGNNVAAFIFGGLIGLMASAASGADNSYPGSVTLILNPKSFDTVAQRDSFFAEMKELARKQAKEAADRERASCTVAQELCVQNVRKLEDQRDQQIAALEQRRLQTPVAGSAVPPQTPPAPVPAPAEVEAKMGAKNPVSFASVAERDAWVEAQKKIAEDKRRAAVQAANIKCGAIYMETRCGAELAASSEEYNAEMARIEKIRNSTPIRS